MNIKILAAGLLLATSLIAAEQAISVADSKVGFVIQHKLLGAVDGAFSSFSGTATVEDGKLTLLVGTVEIASVSTDSKKRDEHLQASDFFNAAKFPAIGFESTAISANEVSGVITIRGVTKPITLALVQTAKGYTLTGELNRKDFGVGDTIQIGDIVKLNIELALAK